jgi:hypothetical protein
MVARKLSSLPHQHWRIEGATSGINHDAKVHIVVAPPALTCRRRSGCRHCLEGPRQQREDTRTVRVVFATTISSLNLGWEWAVAKLWLVCVKWISCLFPYTSVAVNQYPSDPVNQNELRRYVCVGLSGMRDFIKGISNGTMQTDAFRPFTSARTKNALQRLDAKRPQRPS